MSHWQSLCLILYCIVVLLLGVYGFHRYLMLHLYLRHRHNRFHPPGCFEELPIVTVQLPLYNEFHVVERLLEAVAAINYPRDRLQIQVLDDSNDDTRHSAAKIVSRLAAGGLDIEHVWRGSRAGFKAGALACGMGRARGEFIFILDADFLPESEILHRAIHHFTDPRVGMVQMRWGHLNRSHSLLTRIQSIFLDGHFVIEHTARNRSGRFFNFNGTAGIWRRQCIEEAGGWQADTLTEDLDISYRAQLAGWRFVYLPDIVVPGEIPVAMNAFKSQQHRWTKGAVQTAKKLLPRVWEAPIPLKVKLEATFHLTANICYVLMLFMCLLILPTLSIRGSMGWERFLIIDIPLFAFASMAISAFYIVSQRAIYQDWRREIKYLPLLMAVGVAMCINNARAVFEGLAGLHSPFLRTPKYGDIGSEGLLKAQRYACKTQLACVAELAMAVYFGFTLYCAWNTGAYIGLPFVVLFAAGFLYSGLMSALQAKL